MRSFAKKIPAKTNPQRFFRADWRDAIKMRPEFLAIVFGARHLIAFGIEDSMVFQFRAF